MVQSTFSKKDYNSGDGFLTTFWGSLVWTFLHTISFNYPVEPSNEDKKNYKNYLMSLGKVLPCKYCRDNFQKNLKKCKFSDKVFKNRETFSKFIFCLHNEVNKMLDKPIVLTYTEVRDTYETFRARCINEVPVIPRSGEVGCLEPLYGMKSKSVIHIVPSSSRKSGFQFDPKCVLSKTVKLRRSRSKK